MASTINIKNGHAVSPREETGVNKNIAVLKNEVVLQHQMMVAKEASAIVKVMNNPSTPIHVAPAAAEADHAGSSLEEQVETNEKDGLTVADYEYNNKHVTTSPLYAHFHNAPGEIHPHATRKEPHQPVSPAISSISTHCGGSPNKAIPSPSQCLSNATTRSLSNMSHFELCNMSSSTTTAGAAGNNTKSDQGTGRPSMTLMAEEENVFKAFGGIKKVTNKPLSPTLTRAMSPPTPAPHKTAPLSDAPVHRPKQKGEAQPVSQSGFHNNGTQGGQQVGHGEKAAKIVDEAHHFGLCDHYAKLLDQAKEVGFQNVKWPTNFTLFHLAAKKNNKEFIEWLVCNDVDDVHTIDDFGKKPIDYSCPKKRDSVHDTLYAMMLAVPAPDTPEQHKYEAVKNGTYVDPNRKPKEKKGVNAMAAILQSADIAQGDVPTAKPGDMMTAYEAETLVPIEYKKCFKQMANGGWTAMEGKWPNQGQTVLHWAARNGKEELCHFLVLEYGADPHQEDANGHDAMYHAKLKRHRKLAKKLLLKFKEPKSTKGKNKK